MFERGMSGAELPPNYRTKLYGKDGTEHYLPNMEYFVDTASPLFEMLKHQLHFVLAYIDIRGFKEVNAQLTHPGANDALAAFHERLVTSFRTGEQSRLPDTVAAREGGDEFIVLIPHLTGAQELIQQLAATRIADCNFTHNGVSISSRAVFAHSSPAEPSESVLCLYEAAADKLAELRKAEKIAASVHPLQGMFELDI